MRGGRGFNHRLRRLHGFFGGSGWRVLEINTKARLASLIGEAGYFGRPTSPRP
jgi:hypothetical protein